MWYENLTTRKNLLPLAQALMNTEVVQRNHKLTLYCGVPMETLSAKEQAPPSGDPMSQVFDYVFCEGDVPVLTVMLVPWSRWGAPSEDGRSGSGAAPRLNLPEVLSLAFPDNEPEKAQQCIADILGKAAGSAASQELRFMGREVEPASQLEQEMLAAKLLRSVPFRGSGPSSKWSCGQKEPTQYGWECGLMLGFSVRENRTYECRVYYSPFTPALFRTLSRQSFHTCGGAQQWRETIPLEQRLARLQQGLPSDSMYSAIQVQKMANMPLDAYLRDFPEELADLRRALPELEEDAVYRDAAALIHRRSSQHTWTEEPGLSTEYSWCTQILAKPLLRACQEWRKGR